jgi:hypothetical protein
MDVLKWLARWIPRDPVPKAGLGPFVLPKSCAWMSELLAEHHDRFYDIGPEQDPPMRLSDVDSRVFNALVMLANTEPDPILRCHRFRQICEVWPVMHSAGHYLYARDQK